VFIHLHGAQLLLGVIVTITKGSFYFIDNSRKIAAIDEPDRLFFG